MKYMLLMNYTPIPGVPPITEWAPEDIKASGAHMGTGRQPGERRAWPNGATC